MNSSICALGGNRVIVCTLISEGKLEAFTTLSHHQKSNTSAVENVEKMHQKICSFFYIRKKKMKYTYTKPVVMLVFLH